MPQREQTHTQTHFFSYSLMTVNKEKARVCCHASQGTVFFAAACVYYGYHNEKVGSSVFLNLCLVLKVISISGDALLSSRKLSYP